MFEERQGNSEPQQFFHNKGASLKKKVDNIIVWRLQAIVQQFCEIK